MRPALAEGWKRLGSERLLENRYFSLRTDRLRLPDGSIKDPYFVLERPDAAIVFPLTESGEVVLVRQYRPPLEMMELGLPAGLVEKGESPEEAARRELAEAVAATGVPTAAAEAFSPAGAISAFHLDLAVASTRLWPITR